MMAALQGKDYQAVWFDKRKDVNSIRPSAALGFILNVPNSSKMMGWLPSSIFSLKHWIAIRRIGDELYFNLDSHLSEPEVIGSEQDLLTYLTSQVSRDNGSELLIVVHCTISETELWRN